MGLLDKLWDDVVAGPQPDHGLGRLQRKPKIPEGMDEDAKKMAERRRSCEFYRQQDEARRVTSQSIAIAKPPPLLRTVSLDPDYYNFGMAERRRSGEFSRQEEEARRVTSQSIAVAKPPPLLRTDSLDPDSYNFGSAPSTPGAASTPSSSAAVGSPSASDRENVWTSVFHPGNNKVMRKIGSEKFDKQAPNSPTVYDWVVLSALDR